MSIGVTLDLAFGVMVEKCCEIVDGLLLIGIGSFIL